MGSKMSPQFSSLYVALFEQEYVCNPRNPYFQNIKLWKRYVDDIFLVWQGPVETLDEFFSYLNRCHEHLKFTKSHDPREISFLDILIKREGNGFMTDMYKKPTDTCTYLHSDSFHPTHLKKSLPISQYSRIRRICSKQSDYERQADELDNKFRQKGYPEQWVTAARDRYNGRTQEECLIPNPNRTSMDSSACCFLQYSPLGKEFEKIIKQHWHVVSTDHQLSKVFSTPPKIVYKRPPNIRQMLVKSDLPPLRKESFLDRLPEGNFRCGSCVQCNHTTKCTTYKHPHTGKVMKIKGMVTCNQKNVIYLITCSCPNIAYVGKTTRPLKTRIAEHRSKIRTQDKTSPVAVHFAEAGHSVAAMRYIGIEHVKTPR